MGFDAGAFCARFGLGEGRKGVFLVDEGCGYVVLVGVLACFQPYILCDMSEMTLCLV